MSSCMNINLDQFLERASKLYPGWDGDFSYPPYEETIETAREVGKTFESDKNLKLYKCCCNRDGSITLEYIQCHDSLVKTILVDGSEYTVKSYWL